MASSYQQLDLLLARLKQCSTSHNLQRGKQVHAEAIECGLDSSVYVGSALINMYAKCGSMADARQVFDRIECANVVAWTSLILGYAANGQGYLALNLFRSMLDEEGLAPNYVTFVAALKACMSLSVNEECRDRGKALHNIAVDCKVCNGYVESALISMYSTCGSMVHARQVFDSMQNPDVVAWTALVMGYAEAGEGVTALELFTRMKSSGPAPNYVTFLAALKACICVSVKEGPSGWEECRERGKLIHCLAVDAGCSAEVYVQNTLLDMYSKCGVMVEARQIFDIARHSDVVSWNVLILGYAENGQGLAAMEMFTRMQKNGPAPDAVTFVAVLKACSVVGALEFGRNIHLELNTQKHANVILVSCLVDFYAKCGCLVEARGVFDEHAETRDLSTWTALMAGFSSCGDSESVFQLFQGMQEAGLRPDAITFSCILLCCSHRGLVQKGKECFDAMPVKYGIVPSVEHHYNCMLDMLGRADKLDDAMALLQLMPCSPNKVSWAIVLGACRKSNNVEMARLAFQSLMGRDVAAYVLMGQIYASRGMSQEQEMVMGLRKLEEDASRMPEMVREMQKPEFS